MAALNPEDRQRLVERFGRKLARGVTVFHEGDPGSEMFVIRKGRVRILKQVRREERSLAILKPGDFFGEMAILNNHVRSATAVAIEDLELLAFDASTFDTLISSHIDLTVRLIRQIAERLKDADDQIENMMLKDNQSRILNTLLKLARDRGEDAEEGIFLRITPLEFSSKVGLDVDAVKRGIEHLRQSKYVEIVDERILIPNPLELEKLYRVLGAKEDAAP
jgi:CRP/FNR family cyclic AMP-dependent transcriptional regulator